MTSGLDQSFPSAGSPGTLRDRYFDSAGVRLRYVEAGQAEPVVLVHSYAGDLETQWIETGVFDALSRRFRTIAFDSRGHGKSGKPHDASAYGAEMAWDVVRLLDHVAIDRAHVVGYSMGAHIVAQLLTLAPERFLSATLGGGTGRRAWSAEHERRAQIEADEMECGSLASQMLRLCPPDEPPPSADFIRESCERFLSGKDCRALAACRRSNKDQVITLEALAAVRIPVLGVVGSADPYLAGYRELQTVVPQMELVVIPGAVHASAAGTPEFIGAVERFLERNSRPG